jgi:hypothetical protein
MLVSSNPPVDPAPVELEVLTRVRSVSRIAFEIDAVSPLLNASNIRNFRTDCSIETVFSCAGIADIGVLGGWRLEVDLINPAVPVDGFAP